jgi:hypothetical protein
MFGGKWGAFDTTGAHFFDPTHAIYTGIKSIARVRREQPALRYGRQYFREISDSGQHPFLYPDSGQCTLAYSRILDTDEVLVALNLDMNPRNDFITLDRSLNPPGSPGHPHHMVDLLAGDAPRIIEDRGGRSCVRVPLAGHGMTILKRA